MPTSLICSKQFRSLPIITVESNKGASSLELLRNGGFHSYLCKNGNTEISRILIMSGINLEVDKSYNSWLVLSSSSPNWQAGAVSHNLKRWQIPSRCDTHPLQIWFRRRVIIISSLIFRARCGLHINKRQSESNFMLIPRAPWARHVQQPPPLPRFLELSRKIESRSKDLNIYFSYGERTIESRFCL